jgi:hypothetical protein
METETDPNPCTLFPARPPRWEGDCIHCSFLGIPPGLTLICPKCQQTVCAGHSLHHIQENNPVPP